MLKTKGILHVQLRTVLAKVGHKGKIAVVDAGYNVPLGVEVVDLAFMPNIPTMLQVLDGILEELAVEEVYVSEKIKVNAPDLNQQYVERFNEKTKINYVTTEDFRKNLGEVKAIIRTGGYGLHSPNIILQGGCTYD